MDQVVTFRPVRPIAESKGKALKRAPVAPPPKIAWLPLRQLVIDDGYQRGLSGRSLLLIRRLVATWDWNCFKPLSVAPCDSSALYEIVDGQHVAIAAATHGGIELLPCLVLDAATRAQRSAAFVGINSDRVALTPYALYRARLMAGDPAAASVDQALTAAGCDLRETIQHYEKYPAGTLACVSSLGLIARSKGTAVLTAALTLAREANWSPVPSAALKAVAEILSLEAATPEELRPVLAAQSGDQLVDAGSSRRRAGSAADVHSGCMQVILQALPQKKAA